MIVRMAVSVAAAAVLAGCQLLSAVSDPIDLYTVTPKSTFDPDLPAVYWQLAVEAPLPSTKKRATKKPLRGGDRDGGPGGTGTA